jgi:hypothetical protein
MALMGGAPSGNPLLAMTDYKRLREFGSMKSHEI